jgi:hypothetical protein
LAWPVGRVDIVLRNGRPRLRRRDGGLLNRPRWVRGKSLRRLAVRRSRDGVRPRRWRGRMPDDDLRFLLAAQLANGDRRHLSSAGFFDDCRPWSFVDYVPVEARVIHNDRRRAHGLQKTTFFDKDIPSWRRASSGRLPDPDRRFGDRVFPVVGTRENPWVFMVLINSNIRCP